MLTPNDPGSGRLFYWTRQGISLQQLLQMVADMIAAGGIVIPPGPGAGGGDPTGDLTYVLVEDPDHPGFYVITLGPSGTVVTPGGSTGGTGLVLGTATGTAADAGAVAAALLVKAPLNSPIFTGTVEVPTAVIPTAAVNLAQLTAFTGGADATILAKGIVKLAGDLAGTAALPTVPGLLLRALDTSVVHKTANESVDGIKAFILSPTMPDPTTAQQAATKHSVETVVASYGLVKTHYINFSTGVWPARTTPVGYLLDFVDWDSLGYSGVAIQPPGMIDNDRWLRDFPT